MLISSLSKAGVISGSLLDSESKKPIVGCIVFLKLNGHIGTATDQFGKFSLDIQNYQDTIVFSAMGFKEQSFAVNGKKGDQVMNLYLSIESVGLGEVVISEKAKRNTQDVKMSTIELDLKEVKKLPAFMGEVDVMKTIQLMPGVQSGGEGNSGFYVRGGGPDQNLILLDGATVYNASHLFGFFSVFNADAVNDIRLTKGGMPANFGGRLSSVLEVNMAEGDPKEFKFDGGIGLISSRLTAQGPLKKDTSSFLISARRTYIDVLMSPFIAEDNQYHGSGYYFYDLNAKFNYKFSDKDRLYLSGYYGKDQFKFGDSKAGFSAKIPWGNGTGSLRWKHLFSEKLFLNTSATFSSYEFEFGATQSQFDFALYSGVTDYSAKTELTYHANENHNVLLGGEYTYHTFVPNNASAKSGDVVFNTGEIVKQHAHEEAVYLLDEFSLGKKLKFNIGMRFSAFSFIGPFDRYVKNGFGNTIDTLSYSSGEVIKTYTGWEPRASGRYLFNDNTSIKASYTRNYQYVHLASMSSVSLPTDLWVPSSDVVEPQKADQYAVGFFKNFKKNTYESSVEVYYKTMDNVVEFGEGELPENNINDNVDNGFVFGQGLSYGAEFFIKKRTGKLTGWIGYTWSKTTRVFEEINLGQEFVAKYDRRHDLSIVASYELNPKWNLAATFVYATGNALTIPVSMMMIDGDLIQVYGPRNGFRMPDYHRADISATYKYRDRKKFKSSWNFSIYNVYNRMNPYFIYFDQSGSIENQDLSFSAKQVSLFPILPSVTWNFSF